MHVPQHLSILPPMGIWVVFHKRNHAQCQLEHLTLVTPALASLRYVPDRGIAQQRTQVHAVSVGTTTQFYKAAAPTDIPAISG